MGAILEKQDRQIVGSLLSEINILSTKNQHLPHNLTTPTNYLQIINKIPIYQHLIFKTPLQINIYPPTSTSYRLFPKSTELSISSPHQHSTHKLTTCQESNNCKFSFINISPTSTSYQLFYKSTEVVRSPWIINIFSTSSLSPQEFHVSHYREPEKGFS